MTWIGISLFIFVLYLILIDSKNSQWYKTWKLKQDIRKKNRFKTEKLNKHHPNYWMWEAGDALNFQKGNYEAIAILKTFSDSFVIAEDIDAQEIITLYGGQIVNNDTAEKRIMMMEAEKFQEDVLPMLIEDNINDMQLLSEICQNTKQKMMTR